MFHVITEGYISTILLDAGTTAPLNFEDNALVVKATTKHMQGVWDTYKGELSDWSIIELATEFAQDFIADSANGIDVPEISNITELVAPLATNAGDVVLMGDKRGTEYYFPNPAHHKAVESYCELANVEFTPVAGSVSIIIWQ